MSQLLSLTKLAQKVGGEKRLAQWVKRGYLTPTATTAAGRGLYTMADYRRAQKNSTRFIDMATMPELPPSVPVLLGSTDKRFERLRKKLLSH